VVYFGSLVCEKFLTECTIVYILELMGARRQLAFENLAHLGYDERGRPIFMDLKTKKIKVPDKWVEIFRNKLSEE